MEDRQYEKQEKEQDREQDVEQDGEQDWEQEGRRTLSEGVQGSFIWDLTRKRSRDHIHTPVRSRLPNLVCFGCKFPRIL